MLLRLKYMVDDIITTQLWLSEKARLIVVKLKKILAGLLRFANPPSQIFCSLYVV